MKDPTLKCKYCKKQMTVAGAVTLLKVPHYGLLCECGAHATQIGDQAPKWKKKTTSKLEILPCEPAVRLALFRCMIGRKILKPAPAPTRAPGGKA